MERRLAVVFAADVVGFSRLMELDEERTLRAFRESKRIVEQLVQKHQGRMFGGAGDAMMAEFGSTLSAVRAAVDVQTELTQPRFEQLHDIPSSHRMQFRIGINSGEVIADGDALYGDSVNVAARLEALADPGGICISGAVYETVKQRLALQYQDIGEQPVKNISKPVRAYRVSVHSDNNNLLSITSVETFATNWLTPRLGSFRSANPGLSIKIETMSRLLNLVSDGFDVGIRSGLGDWPGLKAHQLLRIEFTPMCSPALLGRVGGKLAEPADLLQFPILDVSDGWPQQWFAMFGIMDLKPASISSIQFVTQLMLSQAVMAGQGVAMLMPAFFEAEISAKRMVQPFHEVYRSNRSYWLVYPQERESTPKIRAFVEWIEGQIHQAVRQ